MNERIQELAHQAWSLTSDQTAYLSRIHNRRITQDETNDIFEQKFALLIVKKCISMADEFEMDVNRSGLVDKMKEYFGVEE